MTDISDHFEEICKEVELCISAIIPGVNGEHNNAYPMNCKWKVHQSQHKHLSNNCDIMAYNTYISNVMICKRT